MEHKHLKRSPVLILICVAAAALATPAVRDAFDVHVANIVLLQAKSVQAELRISDAQRAAMNRHADWYNGEAGKISAQYDSQAKNARTPPPLPEAQIKQLQSDLKKRVLAELSDAQVRRLREISLQYAGPLALMDPEVARKIGLTDAQVKKLKTSYETNLKRVQSAEGAAMGPVSRKYADKKPKNEAERKTLQGQMDKDLAEASRQVEPHLKKLKADYDAAVASTLTPAQKAAYLQLKGAKFAPAN